MLKGRLIVKYIVIVGTIICACVAIAHIVKIKVIPAEPSGLTVTPDLVYNASAPLSIKDKDSLLNSRYLRCFLRPSKPFCKLAVDKRLELFSGDSPDKSLDIEVVENRFENLTATLHRAENSVYQLMSDFMSLLQPYRVKAFVVEPSILFCLLPSSVALNLQLSGVNPGRVLGSRNVVTFGVFEEDSKVLSEANTTTALISAGFKVIILKSKSPESFEPVHYLFIRGQVAAHVVVFFKRRSYLWHAGLDSRKIDFEGLLFVREGIYESFRLRSLLGPQRDNATANQFFIPSNLKYFLSETLTLAYRSCPEARPSPPLEQDRRPHQPDKDVRVAVAIREMKTILAPYMIPFWLCMNSSRGWFKNCNVLYEESTLELCLKLRLSQMSILHEELSKGDVFKTRVNSSDSNDVILLDALGLHVNVYCLFQGDDNEFERTKDQEQNETKPKDESWQFCSTDILGQKVNVPCWSTLTRASE